MVAGELTYSMLNNMTMTIGQCNELFRSEYSDTGIVFGVLIIGFIIILILHFIVLTRYIRLKQFIKDNKLEKKYQEYRKDNERL